MVWKLLLAGAAAAGVLFLCWLLRGALLTPVQLGKNLRLTLCLRVTGPAPELEAAADALAWLMADGVLPARLVIEDGGMDAETRAVAELLTKDNGRISLWTNGKNKT